MRSETQASEATTSDNFFSQAVSLKLAEIQYRQAYTPPGHPPCDPRESMEEFVRSHGNFARTAIRPPEWKRPDQFRIHGPLQPSGPNGPPPVYATYQQPELAFDYPRQPVPYSQRQLALNPPCQPIAILQLPRAMTSRLAHCQPSPIGAECSLNSSLAQQQNHQASADNPYLHPPARGSSHYHSHQQTNHHQPIATAMRQNNHSAACTIPTAQTVLPAAIAPSTSTVPTEDLGGRYHEQPTDEQEENVQAGSGKWEMGSWKLA
ncbi:hypothetical protein F5B19DRAFT_449354, partial [Rostrohypoxylon terebratum]